MIKFSTKAKTLEDLSKVITKAKILSIFRFSVSDFKKNSEEITKKIKESFNEDLLIVRSSAVTEDAMDQSNAGRFKSILNVPKSNKEKLRQAIDEVISSYYTVEESNEVLVQPMLVDIKSAGVVFTADMDTLVPYYIINYDETGRSDVTTSGLSSNTNTKTYIQYKNSKFVCKNHDLKKLIEACKETEQLFDYSFLDIEFAFNASSELYIFQVRPIVINNKENLSKLDFKGALSKIYKKIKETSLVHPNLLGDKAIYGVMPDWNPAEMIGLKPRQLAISLYKEIITDNIWAYQRDNYGYRNLRSHPLMISLLGVPFIDVRVDFNSFIPEDLDEKIANKLVNFYLNKLISIPSFHDKVEFEIVHSCFYFNLPEKLKELLRYDFNENEIKSIEFSLLELTNRIINPGSGLYKKDLEKIEILKIKHEKIINSNMPIIDKIYWLIEYCKRYGTLPFAGVARAAFIATQFLKSLIELNIISREEYNLFINSFNTIAKNLNNDLYGYSQGEISKEEFLKKYGHLRPGTYDILSLRYDENFDNYFSISKNIKNNKVINFQFSKEQLGKIEHLIQKNGLKVNVAELIKFIKESIEGREYAKYIFTKSLSEVLKLIEGLGRKVDASRKELAHIDIKTILNLYAVIHYQDIKDILKTDIDKNKELYKYTKAVKLPSLILEAEDVYSFYSLPEEPNFITLKQIRSEIIKEQNFGEGNLKNKIVFIKSADPGYDFLFTKNIGGLVTQFGGANSHMAVRCAELGIPAVIGAGEQNFDFWRKARVLELDCLNKQVRIIL